MGSRVYKPTENFKVSLDIDISVSDVSEWDGSCTQEELNEKVETLIKNGKFQELLKSVICEDLQSETFDTMLVEYDGVSFDRLNFEIISAK